MLDLSEVRVNESKYTKEYNECLRSNKKLRVSMFSINVSKPQGRV